MLLTTEQSMINIEGDAEEFEEGRLYGTRGSAMKGNEEEFFVKKMYELLRVDVDIEELK